MAINTKIEWADHTFNPWIGCTKVSPGCDNCYAKAEWDDRRHRAVWGPGQARSRTKTWGDPVKWNKQTFFECRCCGWRGASSDPEFSTPRNGCIHDLMPTRARVFCASLADVFDNEVDPQWRVDLFKLIRATPNLDWLLLTKRIGNAERLVMEALKTMFLRSNEEPPTWPWPNVWIGTTIVNQEEADRDIPKLLQVPAAKRFLSMEPLLGPVDLTDVWRHWNESACEWGEKPDVMIDWVIVGGESGHGARPMHPEWVVSLRKQCEAARVAFLFKQWGEWMPESVMTQAQRIRDFGQYESLFTKLDGSTHWIDPDDHTTFDASDVHMVKFGKKAAGRLLDGREWNGVPA